jgi:hypothetical protein
MDTPSMPHGVIAKNGGRLSFVMLMAKPCMEIHFLTPTLPLIALCLLACHAPDRFSVSWKNR